MVSNVVLRRNQHIIINAVQSPKEFCFFPEKLNKDNLIKNDGITPNWHAVKRSKLWKRTKSFEINRRLILWEVNKFHEQNNDGFKNCCF